MRLVFLHMATFLGRFYKRIENKIENKIDRKIDRKIVDKIKKFFARLHNFVANNSHLHATPP
jgi:hypothetical protein